MKDPLEFELEATSVLDNYNSWIAESFYPYAGGSLLEVGAGMGTFSNLFSTAFEQLTLIEPSAKLFEYLENRFLDDPHITVKHSFLDTDFAQSTEQMFDAALMVNVLEHIKDDKEVLELLHSVLNPNGYLLIFVPALQALYSDFDRAVGHHRRYHLKNLKEITETAGFEILKLGYFDWLGASAWWLVNVILQSKKINPKSAKLYDRIGVPVTRTIERIISPPFGKNLIMVAKKIKL